LSLALALACGATAERRGDEPVHAEPTVPSEAQTERGWCGVDELVAADTPADEMAAFELRHQDFARRTLYSWTTAEQVSELRENPALLTRAATAEGEPGRAAEVIAARAQDDQLAALLAQPRFENKRFAWSNAWATARGFGGESYGAHLLRITLREQAWLGRLLVRADGSLDWAFADVAGKPVAAADVLRSPERLAAVYFADVRGYGCGTLGSAGSSFREYFLCNEAMLESYELYTSEVRAEIDRSVSALAGLRQALVDGRCATVEYCWPDVALAEWNEGVAQQALGARYLAALAFPSDEYAPRPANIAELLRLLGQLPFEAPLLYTYPQ
jgi:hypothetical protein